MLAEVPVVAGSSCQEILDGGQLQSGIYTVQTSGPKGVQVYCDMTTDGGGWLVGT